MPQDFRCVWRSLTRDPAFVMIATATLAVAIGLNASIFSVVNVMLFKPLAVERGDELIWVSSASTKPNGPRGNMTHPDVLDLATVDTRSLASPPTATLPPISPPANKRRGSTVTS
jgi:hypothetical protein